VHNNDVDNYSLWTLSNYADTIKNYLEAGYEVGTFEYYLSNKPKKFIALRHDIDFDLSNLEKMLKVEELLGVSSNVFFRVCSKNYNLASIEGISALRMVRDFN
jgi:hypothetical protein